MGQNRWLNRSQPQNLQNATILLYFNAAWALLFGLLAGGIQAGVNVLVLAGVAGAYGIANDKKWGYYLSCVVAVLPLIADLGLLAKGANIGLLNILFEIVLVILLFHKVSRDYVRIWFK